MAAIGGGSTGLRAKSLCPLCELCGALDNLKLCAGCGESYYCSKEHQKSNWRVHKSKCRSKKGRHKVTNKSDNMLPSSKAKGSRSSLGVVASTTGADSGKNLSTTPTEGTSYVNSDLSAASTYTHGLNAECSFADTPCTSSSSSIKIGSEAIGNLTEKPVDHIATKADAYERMLNMTIEGQDSLCEANNNGNMPLDVSTMHTIPNTDVQPNISTSTVSVTDASEIPSDGSKPRGKLQKPEYKSAVSENWSEFSIPTTERSGVNKLKGVLKSTDPPVPSKSKGKRSISDNVQPINQFSTVGKPETKLADYVVKCMNDYGMCVVDTFMGEDKGQKIINETLQLQRTENLFVEGQTSQVGSVQHIRGDKIAWIEKGDTGADYISMMIARLDSMMITCGRRLGNYQINGRTKAMVACYPGEGTGYKRHVDNPKGDGRCITCIYYINKDWDIKKDGGLLRIFPTMFNRVADIVPKFDRLLLFWSDRRNPHEVQPTYKSRLAITVWYFDAEERKRARIQHSVKDALSKAAAAEGQQLFQEHKDNFPERPT